MEATTVVPSEEVPVEDMVVAPVEHEVVLEEVPAGVTAVLIVEVLVEA